MTENEYLVLLSNLREESVVSAQYFVAIFSAYILAIYAIGKKLPTLHVSVLTLCYSLFIAIAILGASVSLGATTQVAKSYAAEYPDAIVDHVVMLYLPFYNAGLLVFCWLLSIAYMIDTRRRRHP